MPMANNNSSNSKNLSSLIHELRERIAAASSSPPNNNSDINNNGDDYALDTRFRAVLPKLLHAYVVPSSSGLVDEGRAYFKSMVSEYGIQRRVEHYASLVDNVGRHGQLEEAMDLVKSMPFEPDKAVWGALLGACRVHNNVELARVAAEALMRLEPESSDPYILLYNMYADVGRWDEAAEVREMMERNKIRKRGAYS